jgi:hypothetical protein
VRLLQWPSGGGTAVRRRLAAHARAAHKLHVSALEPHLVTSAGEDGLVMQCDVRADHVTRCVKSAVRPCHKLEHTVDSTSRHTLVVRY